MVLKMKVFPSLLAGLLVAVLAAAGCGGDDDEDGERAATTGSETAETATTATTETAETETERAEKGDDDGGGSGGSGGSGGTGPSDVEEADGGGVSGGGGGSEEDRRAVSEVVLDFHGALSDGDGGEACSLLAERTRQQIEKNIENAPQLKGRDCAEVIEIVAKNYPDRIKDALGDVKIRKVTIDGDRASVAYKVGPLPATTMPLAREDGEWRVAALAGSGG